MHLLFFLGCLLAPFCLAQKAASLQWSADFTMTIPSVSGFGYSVGKMSWFWDTTAPTQNKFYFDISFNNTNGTLSRELYRYNDVAGITSAVQQYKYVEDNDCQPICSTTGIATSYPQMPPLNPFFAGSGGYSPTFTGSANPLCAAGGQVYSLGSAKKTLAQSFYTNGLTGNNLVICQVILNDGCADRYFTLTKFSTAAFATPIQAPAACSCQAAIDLMITVDHSTSIRPPFMKTFHQFVTQFLASLTFGPNAVSVGIVWWHGYSTPAGVQTPLTNVLRDIVVTTSNCTSSSPDYSRPGNCVTPSGSTVPWQTPCLTSTSDGECNGNDYNGVGRSTCTAAGVLLGAHQLFATGSLRKVPKLFITLTDGGVNQFMTTSSTRTFNSGGNPFDLECGNDRCSILPEGESGRPNTGQNCTYQILDAMGYYRYSNNDNNYVKAAYSLRGRYLTWLAAAGCSEADCPLTSISLGIGIPLDDECLTTSPLAVELADWNFHKYNCRENGHYNKCWAGSYCLSYQHLDVLAGGSGAQNEYPWRSNPNVLVSTDWSSLITDTIPKLLALSCPDNGAYTCLCTKTCQGFCSGCSKCFPPVGCVLPGASASTNCTTVSLVDGQCIRNPIPNICQPTPCTEYQCVENATQPLGACEVTVSPADYDKCKGLVINGQTSQCCVPRCDVAQGGCINDCSACPLCDYTCESCSGTCGCGVPGSQLCTRVQQGTGDFCRDAGATETRSCCCPCDCSITRSTWTAWSTCPATCTDLQYPTRTRVNTVSPGSCGGSTSCTGGTDTQTSTTACDCIPRDCSCSWTSWTCGSDGFRRRTCNVIVEAKNGGLGCPPPESGPCSPCIPFTSETPCSCGTGTKTVFYNETQPTNGGTPCPLPTPATLTTVACIPTGCDSCAARPDLNNCTAQAEGANGCTCATGSCVTATGLCNIDISGCPACEWSTWTDCSGAVACGADGSRTRTRVAGVCPCLSVGVSENEPCCAVCDCTLSVWTAWSQTGPGVDGCPVEGCTIPTSTTRSRTNTPAQCGGSSDLCDTSIFPLSATTPCDCVMVDCSCNEWSQWSCDCATSQSTRSCLSLTPASKGGSDAPCQPEANPCSCCTPVTTAGPCSCTTRTFTTTYSNSFAGSGAGLPAWCTPPPAVTAACPQSAVDALNCPKLCAVQADCDDANACTDDVCLVPGGGALAYCNYTAHTCGGQDSVCISTVCDVTLGCVESTLLVCDDKSVCTVDRCDAVRGCVYEPNQAILGNCTQINDCAVPTCDPFIGCQYIPLVCNRTATDNCTIAGCDPDWALPLVKGATHACQCTNPTGPCYEISTCGLPLGLIAGLAGGSIAAIVACAALIIFGTCAGGTYAYANLNDAGAETSLNKNPIYADAGHAGHNPAHNEGGGGGGD